MPDSNKDRYSRLLQWILEAEITTSIEVIDSDTASKWLGCNTENYRKPNDRHVNNLCRDIVNDQFSFTNASIAFDAGGNLVDGQHRLLAVVKSGQPIVSLVVRNMPNGSAANPSIDSGKNRSCAVHLQNHGIQYATEVASVIRCLAAFHRGVKERTTITNVELALIASKHDDIAESVVQCRSVKNVATVKILGSWFWIAKQENEVLASHCLDVLKGDVSESTLHPFNKLREVCLKDRASSKKMPPSVILNYFFSAWIKTLRGEQVKVLRPSTELKVSSKLQSRLDDMFRSVIALQEG